MDITQPTAQPTAKMTAVGGAGALVLALVTILTVFGVTVPENVQGAVITLITAAAVIIPFVAGYVKRESLPSANSKS